MISNEAYLNLTLSDMLDIITANRRLAATRSSLHMQASKLRGEKRALIQRVPRESDPLIIDCIKERVELLDKMIFFCEATAAQT